MESHTIAGPRTATRRTVVAGAAWTMPAVVMASAAPAYAASSACASETASYHLDWGTSPYVRHSPTLGTATAAAAGAVGSELVTVTFQATKRGRGGIHPDNLLVPTTQTLGGGLGGLGRGERGLEIWNQKPLSQGYDNRQDVVVTFSRPVTGLRFSITDIDHYDWWNGNDFEDAVELTGSYTATRGSNVVGSGSRNDAWRPRYTNPLDPSNGTGNVAVTFAGEVSTFRLSYWSIIGGGQQSIYLSDLTFSTTRC